MSKTDTQTTPHGLPIFTKDTLDKGQPCKIDCIEINGQTFTVSRGLLTVVRLEDEWYEDIEDPQAVIQALKENIDFKPDLFTFWQRMPDTEPKYAFHTEWEEIAVLPVETYDHWWKNKIKSRIRNLIRKAEKAGVEIRETAYDDDFVHGMTAIFNEAPVRQGRKFWHYGKDFETVKSQFSRYLFREHMIGAYYQGEMIGFMMLGNAGKFGLTGQIISSLKHRDKSINNAMIAKAVEVCEKRKLDYLIYLFWSNDSLAEFKRRCGFEKTIIPRYFVPLTQKGKLALKYGAHRGWKEMLPESLKDELKKLRKRWHEFRS
ncbi:MAG: hypothetical protein V3U84_09590 [Thiotrichaceae bacterium]